MLYIFSCYFFANLDLTFSSCVKAHALKGADNLSKRLQIAFVDESVFASSVRLQRHDLFQKFPIPLIVGRRIVKHAVSYAEALIYVSRE